MPVIPDHPSTPYTNRHLILTFLLPSLVVVLWCIGILAAKKLGSGFYVGGVELGATSPFGKTNEFCTYVERDGIAFFVIENKVRYITTTNTCVVPVEPHGIRRLIGMGTIKKRVDGERRDWQHNEYLLKSNVVVVLLLLVGIAIRIVHRDVQYDNRSKRQKLLWWILFMVFIVFLSTVTHLNHAHPWG